MHDDAIQEEQSKYMQDVCDYMVHSIGMQTEEAMKFAFACWACRDDPDFLTLVSGKINMCGQEDSKFARGMRDHIRMLENNLHDVKAQLDESAKELSKAREALKTKATSGDIFNLCKAFEAIQQNKNVGNGYELNVRYRDGILNALEKTTENYTRTIQQQNEKREG